ncbi:CGNR zinc finger domain-containing protein [Streptosporangiaceae bacterium NEAU-GS5]|nr:CGNR zinc finger domain-containing protein [Streptosporangiaceae bacterium NEAU-GS5]
MNFNSHTDGVIAAAVALVNALTPGDRRGKPYEPPPPGPERAAAAWQELRAIYREAREVTAGEADDLAEVAAELRVVFEAVARDDLDTAAHRLNELFVRFHAHPWLDRHDDEPWHLHFHGANGSYGHEWGAGCATGLAVVLGSEHHDRLGVCTAPRCDRVYIDVSRNGTRRFCSTACQNRVKTAAFRARAD